MGGRFQPRAEETRQKLIAAAVRLFHERGYVEVQPKEIAHAAELTPGAFYYHFRSKEDLFAAIVDEGMPKASEALSAFFESTADGLPKFIALTFAVVDVINGNDLQWIGFHLSQAIGHLSPSARAVYLGRARGFLTMGATHIAPAELRDDVTPEQAGELIWMTMTGSQHVADVLGAGKAGAFQRLAVNWRTTLRAIARPDSLPGLEKVLAETAAKYPVDREDG